MPRMTDVILEPANAMRDWLCREPPKATAFIVTIYGDVVAPRGGTLWMGSLIDCCADHGINESLVRTAVSRLVSSGRLEGQRIGRKSFYRLSEAAQVEFAEASRVLYAPPPDATGWLLSLNSIGPAPGWAGIGGGHSMAPDRADLTPSEGLVFSADAPVNNLSLQVFAAKYWPLGEVTAAYERFLAVFESVAEELGKHSIDEGLALALRLRLVHLYRHAALRDPRLPADALPKDWPGHAARRLFVNTYLSLSVDADREVGAKFADDEGLLSVGTEETYARIERLQREQE